MLTEKKQKEVIAAIARALRDPKSLRKPDKVLYRELYPDQVAFPDFRHCAQKVREEMSGPAKEVAAPPPEVAELERKLAEQVAANEELIRKLAEKPADNGNPNS